MIKMYLDWNVILALKKKEFTAESITKYLNSQEVLFPYSAAHVQEADNISALNDELRSKQINEHLDYLSQLTNDLYIYHSLTDKTVSLFTEKPHDVLKTIRGVSFAKTIMKTFINFISPEQKKSFREMLGIDPRQLNNYKPDEVVIQLDSVLKARNNSIGFMEILDQAFNSFPDTKDFGLHNYIASIFELLDMVGYWKDAETDNSNYARLWDSNHTFFASYTDYFVSNDKRTRNKAMVVYTLFKINTKVISSEEALKYL
jgi:hypothetical protein